MSETWDADYRHEERPRRVQHEWLGLSRRGHFVQLMDAVQPELRSAFPAGDEAGQVAELVMMRMGCRFAHIVREAWGAGADASDPDDDGTPALSGVPRWRLADTGETGESAVIVPVGFGDSGLPGSERCFEGPESYDAIADLIALPTLSAPRPNASLLEVAGAPLSLTGMTAAVGSFAPDPDGELIVASCGMRWLQRHVMRARRALEDEPAFRVAGLMKPPDRFETLLLAQRAFEWRLSQGRCVVDRRVTRITCPDSRDLALSIAAAMVKRERARMPPTVYGPKDRA